MSQKKEFIKLHLQVRRLQFDDLKFPVTLKVMWLDTSHSVCTKWSICIPNSAQGWGKPLKNAVQANTEKIRLAIRQKVCTGSVNTAICEMDIRDAMGANVGSEIKSSVKMHLAGVTAGSLYFTLKSKKYTEGRKFGSTSNSSTPYIEIMETLDDFNLMPLLCFEDVYDLALTNLPEVRLLELLEPLLHVCFPSKTVALVKDKDLERFLYGVGLMRMYNSTESDELATSCRQIRSCGPRKTLWLFPPNVFDLGAFQRALRRVLDRNIKLTNTIKFRS